AARSRYRARRRQTAGRSPSARSFHRRKCSAPWSYVLSTNPAAANRRQMATEAPSAYIGQHAIDRRVTAMSCSPQHTVEVHMISETSMEPMTQPPNSSPVPGFRAERLAADVKLAAGCGVPVLVTAPGDGVTTIVQSIAAGDRRGAISDIVACDCGSDDDVIAAIAESRRRCATGKRAILWLKEVHRLKATHQETVLRLAVSAARHPGRMPRIVSSSTADLFGRVREGDF